MKTINNMDNSLMAIAMLQMLVTIMQPNSVQYFVCTLHCH